MIIIAVVKFCTEKRTKLSIHHLGNLQVPNNHSSQGVFKFSSILERIPQGPVHLKYLMNQEKCGKEDNPASLYYPLLSALNYTQPL